MSKRFAILYTLSLVLSMMVDEGMAWGFQMTCTDYLMNTPEMGDTIGKCDLNFISVREMNSIEDTCGIPGTADTPADNKCRIRAIVSPSPEDHGLYKVIEVLTIDRRAK
jgi:hypothetical protein